MNTTIDHLTTGASSHPNDLLRDIPYRELVLILVSVKPRHQRTGMLNEQDAWIKSLWNNVLIAFPDVIGCRVLWNTLLFVFDARKYIEPETVFERILTNLHTKDMKSVLVSRITDNIYHKILMDFDEMQQETSSDLDLGRLTNIRARIVDGHRLAVVSQ